MANSSFSFKAPLEHIDEPGGWWYVHVPKEIREAMKPLEVRGYLKIEATVGKTSWPTTMMPLGGGTSLIAIKAEGLKLGEIVNVTLSPVGR